MPVSHRLLERRFRDEVLALLLREGEVSEGLVKRITAWRHTGFSVHNGVKVRDAAGRQKLAQYMLRAPFSLEKMKYDQRIGMVLYRSHLHKSLKRNYQLMPGAQWLELLCRHIPDRFEHLVRYVGWYSCRCRGERADDPAVVRRILQHLNLWSPAKRFIPARGPPGAAVDSTATESTNALTYHPVPDIA